jgi:hypothetical protein
MSEISAVTPNLTETTSDLVVDHIASFIQEYVRLPHKSFYELVALWVVATYLHPQFDYIGYLFAHSARPQSGKTRLLEVLNLIVYKPSGIIISPTEAVLFRTASDQTQLIDEADSCGHLDSFRSVLNAGFQRGGIVKRMERDKNDQYKPVDFSVYGPRALAGIGLSILDQTTQERTFIIQMVPQKKSERSERFRVQRVKPKADALRREIEQWVSANRKNVLAKYNGGTFGYLEHFRDRTIDVTESLAAVLEIAYDGAEPEILQRARQDLLDAVTRTRKEQEAPSFDARLLGALATLAKEEDPLVGNASELASRLNGVLGEVDGSKISEVLRRHGYETKSVRKTGDNPLYRYSLSYASLADLVDRYSGTGMPVAQDHGE